MLFKVTVAVFALIASAALGQEASNSAIENPAWLDNSAGQVQRLPPVALEDVPGEEAIALPPATVTNPPAADSSTSQAGDGKNSLFPPMMSGQRLSPLTYRAAWFPTVHVSGQDANFSMVDQSISITAPLGISPSSEGSQKTRPPGGWLLTASVRNHSITTDAILPDTGQPYPDQLWNVNMGLMYFHKFENDWFLGGGVNLGSASDRPFASIDEMFVGMNAFLRIPSGERNAWMFSVFYAPSGELRFPIPGVAYYYAPTDNFHMNIGLPFSIMYRPLEDLTLEASYMPIHTIHAKAKYKIVDWLSAFAAYDWANESFALADRVEVNQRFFLYDQRVAAGLESNLGAHGYVEFAAGLIFDRYSFEGQQWDTTQFNRVNMGSGPFVTLQAGWRF